MTGLSAGTIIRTNATYRTIDLVGRELSKLTPAEVLLTPSEVARLFRVDPKTVTRWARAGKLTPIRTLGGHRRYRESEVKKLLQSG